MRIMITGGGTGGHTSPAIAVYEELRRRDSQLRAQWVGCAGRIEERQSKALGIPFRAIPVAGWPRRRGLKQVWVGLKLLASLARSAILLRSFRPQVVFGVGGYVSLPLCWMAQWLGIPTVIHEQNRRLGMANRLLAPKATRVFLSFEDTLGEYPEDRAAVVGNPVRAQFQLPPEKDAARRQLQLETHGMVVLICGGSQGARSINNAVMESLAAWVDAGLQIVWATGTPDYEKARAAAEAFGDRVKVHSFLDEMAAAYAAADLVVGRAGASTTAELAVMGKPCILIPYPKATDNHQMQNARTFDEARAGEILEDALCDGEALSSMVLSLTERPEMLEDMGRNAKGLGKSLASEDIAEGIMYLVFNGEDAARATP